MKKLLIALGLLLPISVGAQVVTLTNNNYPTYITTFTKTMAQTVVHDSMSKKVDTSQFIPLMFAVQNMNDVFTQMSTRGMANSTSMSIMNTRIDSIVSTLPSFVTLNDLAYYNSVRDSISNTKVSKDTFTYYTNGFNTSLLGQNMAITTINGQITSINGTLINKADKTYVDSVAATKLDHESDPTIGNHIKAITTNISNWNSAYSWGNHTSAGYMTPTSTNTLTNKSGNISQWTNNTGYLVSETDPVWTGVSANYRTISQNNGLYYPLSSNPGNYLTGITSPQVITALGYTPYNGATNINGYISSYTETDPLFNTKFSTKTTSDLPEGTPLYYTPARARTAISVSGSGLSYNSSTGMITSTILTEYINSATTTSGIATFYLTSDKTLTGTALYTTNVYPIPIVNDANANYTYGWTISPDKKTLAVTVKATGSSNVLTNLIGGLVSVLTTAQLVANGTSVQVTVKGN